MKRSTTTASANGNEQPATMSGAWEKWQSNGQAFWQQMDALVETLGSLERA